MSKISPENLVASSQNLDGLVANYNKALITVVSAGDLALSGLANWRQGYLGTEQKLEHYLKEHEEKVITALEASAKSASGIITIVPEVLHGLADFSRDDRQAYQQALQAFSLYSAKSDAKRHASSSSLPAINAALDRRVLREVNNAFSTYSAKSDAKRSASSYAAVEAIYRIVDRRVYRDAKNAFSPYSAKSEVRSNASAEPARLAMENALDGMVIRDAKNSFSAYSVRSSLKLASANLTPDLVEAVVEEAFPDEILNQRLNTAKKEFIRQFNIPPFIDLGNLPSRQAVNGLRAHILQTETTIVGLGKLSFIKKAKLQSDAATLRSYQHSMEQALNWAEANQDIINRWRLLEQEIRSPHSRRARTGGSDRRQSGGRQSGARQSSRTSSSRPRETQPSAEESIYRQAETRLQAIDRSLAQTLRGYPRQDVIKVIREVLNSRQAAAQNGSKATDRDLLIGYMKISNNNPNATPQQIQATQIMMTLMGNKVSGKLPF